MAGSAGDRFRLPEHGFDATVDLAAAFAATCGVGATAFQALSDAGKLAWCWLAFNEPIIERLQARSNARIVVYEDLCRQPEAVSADLFAFAGLHWHKQTSDFLAASTHHKRPSDYYDVYRLTSAAPDRWRQRMSWQDQEDVQTAVGGSPLARYWGDLTSKTPEKAV